MNLKEKPWYNRQILQIKVVKYGKRTKNQREEEKLLPLWCSLLCSWISQENIHPIEKNYKEKCLNMVEEQKITEKQKSCYIFYVHESKSKTFI